MKKITLLLILISIALLASACAAPASEPAQPVAVPANSTPTPFAAAFLTQDYPDAASLRNQLAYGILKLDASASPITTEQAKALLPLWQALRSLSGSTTASDEEITALQNQIVEALQPEQLQAIAAMQVTNTTLNAYYAEFGIVMPTPRPASPKCQAAAAVFRRQIKRPHGTAARLWARRWAAVQARRKDLTVRPGDRIPRPPCGWVRRGALQTERVGREPTPFGGADARSAPFMFTALPPAALEVPWKASPGLNDLYHLCRGLRVSVYLIKSRIAGRN